MNPPEFLALERGKQFSRCVVPQFLAKFSMKSSFCLFPTSLRIQISNLLKYVQLLMLQNGEAEQNY